MQYSSEVFFERLRNNGVVINTDGTRYSNSCFFISVRQFLEKIGLFIDVQTLRRLSNFRGDNNTDVDFNRDRETIGLISQMYNLQFIVHSLSSSNPRKMTFGGTKKPSDKYNIHTKEVHIINYNQTHFELVTKIIDDSGRVIYDIDRDIKRNISKEEGEGEEDGKTQELINELIRQDAEREEQIKKDAELARKIANMPGGYYKKCKKYIKKISLLKKN